MAGIILSEYSLSRATKGRKTTEPPFAGPEEPEVAEPPLPPSSPPFPPAAAPLVLAPPLPAWTEDGACQNEL